MSSPRAKTKLSSTLTARLGSCSQANARGVARTATPSILLDIPFAARGLASSAGAVWDAHLSCWRWNRGPLPGVIEPFRSRPYSYERYREDEVNGRRPTASTPTKEITPRPHQTEAAKTIVRAKRNKRVGFLLGDEVGLGKTI